MPSRIARVRPYAESTPFDISPDGKAFRSSAATHRIPCGAGAPLDNLTAFTAILIVRATATMNDRVLLGKQDANAFTVGWAIRQAGASGAMRLIWKRAATNLNYTTTDFVHGTSEFSVVIVTVDQAGPAGQLVAVEYAPWGRRLKSTAMTVATDGAGAFANDATAPVVIANTAANDNSAFADYAFVGLWPKLTRAQRAEVALDLLAHRGSSLGFWRPGHRGYAGRVLDESGNGHDGTQTSVATNGARSSIPGLWLRPWMIEAVSRAPSGPQTVALSPAIASGVAQALAVALGGMSVPLTEATAAGTAQDVTVVEGFPSTTVTLTEAIASAISQDVAVTTSLGVSLTEAVASGVAETMTVSLGGGATVALTEAVAGAVAPDVGTALGGLTLPLDPAIATGTAQDITVIPSIPGIAVSLTPAVAGAVVPQMTARPGRISEREHFASSLGKWAAVTAGDGAVTVTDSMAKMEVFGAASSGAAIRRAFPHVTNHIFAANVRNAQDNPNATLRILNKATAPTCDTAANLAAIENMGIDFNTVSGTRRPRIFYRQPNGVQQFWNDGTKAWTNSSNVGSTPSGQNDSSLIYGYQWDVTNSRVRFFVIGAGSGTSQIEACGPKIFALTDWVPFSSIRDTGSTTLWITIGKLNTDPNNTGNAVVEWSRIEDGPKIYAAANQATVSASAYSIKLWESYGGRFWLQSGSAPQRTSIVTQGGTQPWCSIQTQMGAGVTDDDGTMWLFFNGRSAANNSVGVTKSTDGGVTWTPFSGNPIIQQVTGTNLQNLSNISAVKDMLEPNAAKRYKLFVGALGADGNRRIFLYSASAPESTWTQEGMLAGPDVDSPTGYAAIHMNPIYHNNTWHVFTPFWRWSGSQLNLASLVKSAHLLGLEHQNVSQVISAISSTSRTVTVANSAGFIEDAMIIIDDDTNPAEWALNRVRKNVNGTTFEMYERTPGYAPNAKSNRLDAGDVSMHHVSFDEARNEWCFYVGFFRVTATFNQGGTIAVNIQTCGLAVANSPLAMPAIDWFDTPQVWLARDQNTGTSENMKFFDPPLPAAQKVAMEPAVAAGSAPNVAVT
ncbi:MAG TPA: hypothetical protein VGQ52_03500 [Gemmatimonadaceae bacterium]|nr:hypothetical protein [Gemmatimonadaceae bacterium]